MSGTVTLSVKVLEDAVARVFVVAGVPADEAVFAAADLVAAEVEGIASHGIMLLPMYLDRIRAGSVTPAAKRRVLTEKGGALVLDAAHTLGQPTARQAVDLAISGARAHGLAGVAVRNAFHLGAIGRYARMLSDAGCIGLVTTNTRPLLPAPGGAEPVTGNNPLAIAVPSSGPYAAEVDMALSAVAMGKIRNAAAAGQSIPDTWATDSEGRATTDPKTAIAGMLLPAAGPKGFGLAFILDLIAGGLSGGAIGAEVGALYGDPAKPYGCAAFILAIDAGFFGATDLAGRTEAALSRASNSPRAPGVAQVYAPGEMAYAARVASDARCAPQVAALKSFVDAAQTLGVDLSSLLQSGQ